MQSVLLSFATMISTDFVCVCVLGAVIISRYFRSLRLFCLFRFSDLPSVSNIVFFLNLIFFLHVLYIFMLHVILNPVIFTSWQ